jgi:neutral ceramidase
MRIALSLTLLLFGPVGAYAEHFKVGFAEQNITPARAMPMWGYGDRHNALSTGVLDPLMAKAVVIDVGTDKLAIVGLDLGRSPRDDQMNRIRTAIKQKAGVGLVMISGSHTHHGPVLELVDEVGKGRGIYDDAVAYSAELELKIVDTIVAASKNVQDAKIGWGNKTVNMNRNRHSKIDPKPTDPELGVIRFDSVDGKPLAVVVNFAAHPTMLKSSDLRFSAEWPGQMENAVTAAIGVPCVFMQGASGDMSVRTTPETKTIETFGKAMADHVTEVAGEISTSVPEKPSLSGTYDTVQFDTRLPFDNPLISIAFSAAFFPELAGASMSDELRKNKISAHLTTVLVNGSLALVGGSGEFFCDHAIRLKQRSRADETFFFGYCNGHNMYFPTIEGAAQGGYGADPTVSWVNLGAGEEMMNRALINIYTMMGKYEFSFPGL